MRLADQYAPGKLPDGMLVTPYSYRGADARTQVQIVQWRLPRQQRQSPGSEEVLVQIYRHHERHRLDDGPIHPVTVHVRDEDGQNDHSLHDQRKWIVAFEANVKPLQREGDQKEQRQGGVAEQSVELSVHA